MVVVAVAIQQWQFWHAARLDTDVLALLPENERAPELAAATRFMVKASERTIVVLVAASDWQVSQQLAVMARTELLKKLPRLRAVDARLDIDKVMAFYQPWNSVLLTADQRAWLQHADSDTLQNAALMQLYQPTGSALGSWRDDPLALTQQWWLARMAVSKVRPREGWLWLETKGQQWILQEFAMQGSAFDAAGSDDLTQAVAQIRQQIQTAVPAGHLLVTGVPLYAESVAAQAGKEMSIIGSGSLLAVVLLLWFTFRSLRPVALVALSLFVGIACALSVTSFLFERVHLLTLVFGSSLVGVAEDYGFHYFAARQGLPDSQRKPVMWRLLPGLSLALLTSALAYLVLGLAPFPGLRQMAVFSAVGLAAAFATVVCWYPILDRGELASSAFSRYCVQSLRKWPKWPAGKAGLLMVGIVLSLLFIGAWFLKAQDDVRQLQRLPASLLDQQRQISELLNLPSPAQFFIVGGDNSETTLLNEEALRVQLDAMAYEHPDFSYRAISLWSPSLKQQKADWALKARAEQNAIASVYARTGENPASSTDLSPPSFKGMTMALWQGSPAEKMAQGLWLGKIKNRYYSVVQLSGLTPSYAALLQQRTSGLAGVRWVDRTDDMSQLLARYRIGMTILLLLGYVAVFVMLYAYFGRQAWRALLPTLMGSALAVALLSLLGQPIQLFMILALLLLLGMGVDYGIFLLEHPGDGAAWLAVALAGVSTLLSFGLLALSMTPALEVFGSTMLLGATLIWFMTPLFRLERIDK